MKKIPVGTWSRQLHIANAGLKAGWSWTKGQLGTATIIDKEAKQLARERLTEKQTQQWVQEIGKLKGGVVKAGQILATYADYCLPPALAKALHSLESDTTPVAWEFMSPYIHQFLGNKQELLNIETSTIAAASLSQVYKATITGSNNTVCLKVLYPDIEKTLESDFRLLKQSIRYFLNKENKKHTFQKIDEIQAILLNETDLTKEAGIMHRWQSILLVNDNRYIIPVTYPELSSSNILTMSFERGASLHDKVVANLSQYRRNRLAENMLELLLSEILLWGEMQTDPHAGNYLIHIDTTGDNDRIVLLDFGSVRTLEKSLLEPLRKILLAAYRDETSALQEGLIEADFISPDSPNEIKNAFSSVLLGMIEPLNYKARIQRGQTIPSYAMDNQGNYCWAGAKLPERMGKLALQSACSQYFSFPGADFMLVARKLAGVYGFIAALDAKFDASIVMKRVLAKTIASTSEF